MVNMGNDQKATKINTVLNQDYDFLSAFYESISYPFFTVDFDLKYICFNNAHFQFIQSSYGVEIEVGKSVLDYYPDQSDRESHRKIYEKVLAGEQLIITENIESKLSEKQIVEFSYKPLREKSNEISGISVISKDLTEWTKAPKRDSKSAYLFEQAFNNSPSPMTIARQSDGRYIEVNESFLRLVELGRDEVIGKTGDELKLIDTEARNKILEHVRINGNIRNIEINAKSHTGKELVILTSIENARLAGEPCTLATMIDITHSKKVENKLREREIEHDVFIQTAMDGFWFVDKAGRIKEVNESYSKMVGYSIPELLTMSVSDLEAIENPDWINSRIKRVLKYGFDRFETKHRCKDGHLIDLEVSIQGRYKEGESVISFFRDITERKRNEEALLIERNKLNAAFENPSMGFVLSNADGTDITMNATALKFHEFDTPEHLLKTVEEYENNWELRYPDGKLMPYNEWPLVRATRGDFVQNFEIHYHNTKSNKKWICNLTSEPVRNNEGEIIYIVQTLLDITNQKMAEYSLKESEEKFRNVFEYSMLGKSMTMMDGSMILNKSFCRILGYTENELKKLKWYDITYPDDVEFDVKIINELIDNKITSERWEKRYIHKTGKIVWVDINTTLMRDNEGNPLYFITSINDITERKLAEENLRQSEERYRHLFEQNYSVMLILNPDSGEIMDANPAACEFYGWTYNEIRNKKITDINVISGKEAFNNMQNAKSMGKMQFVFKHRLSNGKIKDVEAFSTAIDYHGSTFLYVIIHDITERIQAEESLKENRAKLGAALSSMTDAVFISDKDGNFIEFNDAFAWFHRFKNKIECSRTFAEYPDLLEVYMPDGELAPVEMWAVPRALNGETVTNAEYILKRKDNFETWIGSYSFSPILDDNNEIVGSVVVARDVTEQKLAERKLRESEAKLSTLFSSMTEMVVIHELIYNEQGEPVNYRIIDCNESFTKLVNMNKSDITGKLATEIYEAEKAPYLAEYSKVAITGKSLEFNTYYEPFDKYFLISVVSPEKNQFATITNDISEIQRIQFQVTEKNKELENYLYVASHDLRSPLVNIQGFSQRLIKQTNEIKSALIQCELDTEIKETVDKIADEGMPKTLNYILSNVTKMDNLINSLLQISRTGRLLLNIKQVDMYQLVRKIIESYNFQITEISAIINIDKLENCYGDENQLNQLFSNIIDNAIKYHNPEKQMVLNISSYSQFNKVIYVIADTGIGIKNNNIERIWDVFYRTDYATSIKGEGIGLSIAKRIVNKHNGKIWVESEFGAGSKFYIELQKNEFTEF